VWKTDLSNGSQVFARRRYPYDRRPYRRDEYTSHIGTFVLRRASSAKNHRLRQNCWLPKVEIKTARRIRLQHGRSSTVPLHTSTSVSQRIGRLVGGGVCSRGRSCWTCRGNIPALQDVDQSGKAQWRKTLWYSSLASISHTRAHSRSRDRTDLVTRSPVVVHVCCGPACDRGGLDVRD
jgi:hypothetical protein